VNTRFTPTFDAHFHAFVGANLVFARSLMVKIRIAENSGFGLKIPGKNGKIAVTVSGEFTCILVILL
jgi:hypothetical protein